MSFPWGIALDSPSLSTREQHQSYWSTSLFYHRETSHHHHHHHHHHLPNKNIVDLVKLPLGEVSTPLHWREYPNKFCLFSLE
jgi:hypothetical protein